MHRSLLWLVAFALAVLVVLFLVREPAVRGGDGAARPAPEIAAPRADPSDAPALELVTGAERAGGTAEERSAARGVPAAPAPSSAEDEPESGAFQRDAVYGVCTGEGGAPVAGALVRLFALPDRWTESEFWMIGGSAGAAVGEAVTDEAGGFRITGCEPFDEYFVVVRAEGHSPLWKTVRPGRTLELELEGACTVEGRVVARGSGAAVPGARVALPEGELVGGEYRPWRVVTTDEAGAFRFDGLERGSTATFQVQHPDHLVRVVALTLPDSETSEVRIELDRGRAVEVAFLDLAAGHGVAGAELSLYNLPLGRADARGRLALRIPADRAEATETYSLRASAEGYCDSYLRVAGTDLLAMDDFRVPMLPGAEVTGTVTDAEGGPVEGATVEWDSRNRTDPLGRSPTPGVRFHAPRGDVAHTGGDGRFHLRGLVAGKARCSLVARRAGFAPARADVVLLQPGQREHVEIVLEPAAEVFGTVTRDGEGTLAHVNVRSGASASGWRPLKRHVTNDAGEYRAGELVPGEIELVVFAEGGFSFGSTEPDAVVRVGPGESVRADLALDAEARETIEGVVLEADGAPVDGVHVVAIAFRDGEGEMARSATDAGGRFVLDVAADASLAYTLSVSSGPAQATCEGVSAGTADVELRFDPLAEVPLSAFDARSQRRLERVAARWRTAGSEEWHSLGDVWSGGTLRPGADGAFRLPVRPGLVDLWIEHAPTNHLPALVEGLSVGAGDEPTPLRVDLERGVELRLSFVPDGELAELPDGAWLEPWTEDPAAALGPPRGPEDLAGSRYLHADGEGRCLVRAVAPGRYSLRHPRGDVELRPNEIRIADAETASVEIRFTGDPEAGKLPLEAVEMLERLGY